MHENDNVLVIDSGEDEKSAHNASTDCEILPESESDLLPSQCHSISSNNELNQRQSVTRRSGRGFIPLAQLAINPEEVLRLRDCPEVEKLQNIDEKEGRILKVKPECADLKVYKVRFPKLLTIAYLGEIADSFKYCVNNVDATYKQFKKKFQWTDTDEEKGWFYKPMSPDNPPKPDGGENEGPFYPTSQMLPDASPLELIRIDHYRQMFTWKKRHQNTIKRKAEYILDFKRKNRNDLYKVKWCGLPKYAATWVRPVDVSLFRYEFARKVFEFWQAVRKVVPHKKMPVVRRSNSSIPDEYVPQLCSEYQKEKRESMVEICAENPLKDALLIENEYDVFASPFNFEFISANKFSGTEEQLQKYEEEKRGQKDIAAAMGHFCKEECGECSWNLYKEYALAVHRSYKSAKHYKYIEERNYWKVSHPPDFLIFECISSCKCKQDGKCKLDMLAKLRENHSKTRFLVSRTGDDRGWGLTAMQPFKQGEPVIEYVGELMTEENFRQNETQIWRKGLMYSMDLTQNDRNLAAYTVDSSRMGNHSRLINHSCDPNLVTYKIIKEDRNINRPHPVLFAARDIAIGEELNFNYKLTIIEQSEGSSRDDDNSDSDEDCITVENGRPFLCHCGSKKCIDREKHEKRKTPKKKNLKRKNDSKSTKSKKPKIG